MNEEYIKFFGNIQIVRNVKKYPFVASMSEDEKKELMQAVIKAVSDAGYKCQLLERPVLLANRDYFNILYGFLPKDEFPVLHIAGDKVLPADIYIIMCRDDHLTFRVCLSRSQHFDEVYNETAKVVQIIGEALPYQADLRYGYLSPSLDRAGLGITLSYMMHGLGLKIIADEQFVTQMRDRGYRMDKLMMNDKEISFIRIVSERQYGLSENELISEFSAGINTFIEMENRELIKFYNKNKQRFDDKILRSFGILKFSKSLAFNEAFNMLDDILTGLRLHILEYSSAKLPKATVCDLMLSVFDGVIAAHHFDKCDDIAECRAEIIKTYLKKIRET